MGKAQSGNKGRVMSREHCLPAQEQRIRTVHLDTLRGDGGNLFDGDYLDGTASRCNAANLLPFQLALQPKHREAVAVDAKLNNIDLSINSLTVAYWEFRSARKFYT